MTTTDARPAVAPPVLRSSAAAASEMAPRARRADALRNRDALVQAATAAFAERGAEVSLEEIAASAGVGIGTLYRNFPSREALIIAAYRQGVEQFCEAAHALRAEHDPERALELWLQRMLAYMAGKRGLAGALKETSDNHGELFVEVRKRIIDTMDLMLTEAAASKRIRADVRAEDLVRALGGICMAGDQPDWQDQALRMLNLIMDGLRYGAHADAAG